MKSASARDTEALRYLGTYRFLSRAQIEELVLGESTLTPRSREVITWRILRRLRELRLVTTNAVQAGEPEGMPTRIAYFLTAAGRRVFHALEPGVPRWRTGVEGTFLIAHALMVAEIALTFRRVVRASSIWIASPPHIIRVDVIPVGPVFAAGPNVTRP